MQVHVGCIISCIWNIWILKSNGESFFCIYYCANFFQFLCWMCVEETTFFPEEERSGSGLWHKWNGIWRGPGNVCPLHCSCVLSHIGFFATPWTISCQAPLSMGFSRQGYCSGLPFPPPGDLPNPRIESMSPVPLYLLHWQAGSLPRVPPGKPMSLTLSSRKS